MKIETIHITDIGENIMIVDEEGKMIPELSCNLILLLCEHLAKRHYNLDGCKVICNNKRYVIRLKPSIVAVDEKYYLDIL